MNAFFSSVAGCHVRWQSLPGSGTPLVFVHGLGCASSYEYPRVVTDAAFGGRQAILIDLPGCGYSQKPQDFSYSISDQAKVVAELVDHLNLPAFFLYGHSMGGSISIEAAEILQERLSGLVVSEPNFHPGGGFFSKKIISFPEEAFIQSAWQQMVDEETSPWAGSLAVDAPWALWRGAASLIKGNNWLERFVHLSVKKQLIFGEFSLPDDDFSYLASSDISTCILPACGHSMSWENPHALAGALSDFCR
ncbi:alpha/beta fold hydrolase [Huaxiibacter chinensis]|uniref:alpha/beta fold hydrolase n=1 Tax=Huaxiibacter chinensis TaxID=2899785 RepID=UPI003D3166D3